MGYFLFHLVILVSRQKVAQKGQLIVGSDIPNFNKLKSDLIDTLHVGDVERPDLFLDKTNSVFKSIEACSDIKTRLQFNGQ